MLPHINICTYIHTYLLTCTDIHTCIQAHTYIYIYTHTSTPGNICRFTCCMVQFTDLSSYRIVVCSVALCSISIRHEVSCHIRGMRLPCYTNRARLFVRVNRHSTGHATLLHIPSSCSSSCAHVWLQSCHPACSLVLTRFWIYIYICVCMHACMYVCMYVCISIYLSI